MSDPAVLHNWNVTDPVAKIVRWGMQSTVSNPYKSFITIQVDGEEHEVELKHGQLVGLQNFYRKQMDKK